ncbi:MAG: leucine-rich repeat domain-containing protein [bacterium]|nr:leucine-rich repeat domain-containing protein [bacterium]
MSLRKRLGAVGFHVLFSIYALMIAPRLLDRLRSSVEDNRPDLILGWIVLTIGLLEIPALYGKIQAVAGRLKTGARQANPEGAETGPPVLLFVGWFCHFVISGVMLFALFESLGGGTDESDQRLQIGMFVLVCKEFWLGGLLLMAKGRELPRALEWLCDAVLFAFACLMHTIFWQFTLESSGLDVYALPLLIMNTVLIAFFFLLSYTATQLPYLWEHSAGLKDENEYSRWLLSLAGTAALAVAPILYGALDGRYTELDAALTDAREDPRQVRTLALNRTELTELSPRIGELSGLRMLYLHENKLRVLPSSIGRLQNLELLQTSYNRLVYLPEDLSRLRRLKTLQLYVNRIQTLPADIDQLTELQELHAGWNPISRLPDALTRLENLRVLNISDCRLLALPEDIGRLRKLRVLKAPNNRLTDVPESLFELDLDELNLRGNPLPPALVKRIEEKFGPSRK